MKNVGRNKSNILFKTLFQGYSVEKEDFVKFKNGKTVYWVVEVNNSLISVYTIPKQNEKTHYKIFKIKSVGHRLRKVPKKLVFYYFKSVQFK